MKPRTGRCCQGMFTLFLLLAALGGGCGMGGSDSNAIAVADPDLRWAAGVAAFAEILKKSPFADLTYLPEIDAVVAVQAGRDGDRTEFAQLYGVARTFLPR